MSIETMTVILIVSMIVLIMLGVPVAFALGGMVVFFSLFWWGPASLYAIISTTYHNLYSFVMIAIPLFVLMANILQNSGVADDLYTAMHRWFGPLRGGLAMGTVTMSTVFAAMSGVSSAGVITMGTLALPPMLKRGYDKRIATGCIMAGGALGQLIPPSVILIIYGLFAQESIGRLFLGGVVPGFLLATLFITYIGISCYLDPKKGPPLPPEERVGWSEKIVSLKGVILPILIVLMVLGSIFTGVATPSEAASVGTVGAIISAAIYRRLTIRALLKSAKDALIVSGIVLWIVIAATCLASVYNAIGAPEFVKGILLRLPGEQWGVLVAMQLIFFVLGCFLDAVGILMVTGPLFIPVASMLGFDLVWFGVLWAINMECAFLTPPFGMNLFLMRGIAPAEVTMIDIYRAVIPFVILDLVGLTLAIIFPQLVLWLPNLVFTMLG